MDGSTAIERVPTGIDGFDHVALGGLPARRSTLVSGTTGSGKTVFAVEFLARGILCFDEPGVFVTFEEAPAGIRLNSASLGFPIERWEDEGRWAFVDASDVLTDEAPAVGAYDFGGLAARVTYAVRRTGARRVVLDSLGALFARFADAAVVRRELLKITLGLQALGVTSVVTAERPGEYDGVTRHGVEPFVMDNVVVLRNALRRGRRSRTLEIVKFRGAAHRTGEWIFTIDPAEGIVLVPPAFLAASTGGRASTVRVSSGNAGLDEMCGGGLYRDAVVLVSGPTGMGKTLTALRFAATAAESGERCLICTFDETREQLLRDAGGWGLDLRAMEASGLLRVVSGYPEVASPEDHFLRIRRSIEEFAPTRLVVDTLSSLERVVSQRALLDFVIALGALLRRDEITTLLTAAPTGHAVPAGVSAVTMEIAGLADVWIMLRYAERAGEARRAVTVLRARGSAHDHRIREFTIDGGGMRIGEPLNGVPHVSTGNADPTALWPPSARATDRPPG
ncbi:circadian clock protein KaiC [Sphaerisporangium corydalis]|uniref:non-specific serine/threonine protein kinase n=1 Tax=Sphaerisporangium corydalis TaxID=1441875 RepID=A0ABV9ENL5_9ACTN|nr:circadian clock protein KaiC [Sphaerisporangium corydalis]